MANWLLKTLPFLTLWPVVLAAGCTHNNLYRGLLRDGGVNFCSSLLIDHNTGVITPTAYTTYPPSQITSVCSCLITLVSTSGQTTSTTTRTTTASSTLTTTTSSPQSQTTTSGAEFTGITTKASFNQTTCYATPVPTAGLTAVPFDNGSQELPRIDSFLFDSDGTTLAYLKVLGSNGLPYLYDLSDPTKMAVIDGVGNSVFVDKDGIHFSDKACKVNIDINIDNFFPQVEALNETTGSTKRSLDRRTAEENFFVETHLKDQCDKPLDKFVPGVEVGPSPCLLVPGGGNGLFTFECQFPGEISGQILCEKDVQKNLDFLLTGTVGTATAWATVWTYTRAALARFIVRETLAAVLIAAGLLVGNAFGGEALIIAEAFAIIFGQGLTILNVGVGVLGGIQAIIAIYNQHNPDQLKEDLCKPQHEDEFPLPLFLYAGTSSFTLAELAAAPVSFIETTQMVHDPGACCSEGCVTSVPTTTTTTTKQCFISTTLSIPGQSFSCPP